MADRNHPRHCRRAPGVESQHSGCSGWPAMWPGGHGPTAGPAVKELLGEVHEPPLNSQVLSPSGPDQEGRRAPCALSPQPPMARFQPAALLYAASPARLQPRSKPKQHTTSLWLAQTQACKKPGVPTKTHSAGPGMGVEAVTQVTLSTRLTTGHKSPVGSRPRHTCTPAHLVRVGLAPARTPSCSPCNWAAGLERLKRMRNQI